MLREWDASRKRMIFRPEAEEATVARAVCDVVLANPDMFPKDEFEAGLANSIGTLLNYNEGWTKDQAINFAAMLRKFNLGDLAIPDDGKVRYELVADLFEGIKPIGRNG